MKEKKDEMYTETLEKKKNPPVLFVFHKEDVKVFNLEGRQTFGRRADNNVPDLYVEARIVSRIHGEFLTTHDSISYMDLGSSNGTTINESMIEPMKREIVSGGSVLRIHASNSTSSANDIVMVVMTKQQDDTRWSRIPLNTGINNLEVGRGQEISLRGRTVSRRHATFARAQNGWAIIDNHSLNGVFLNGKRVIEPVLLQPMDVIRIAGHLFVFLDSAILYQEDRAPSPDDLWKKNTAPKKASAEKGGKVLSINIEDRTVWSGFHKKTILQDVSLQIESGSLVLILGGSGAGKTTFMNAVMGYEPAKGRILYGKADIYREFEKMKYEIGYVPQQDLLRMEDVVYDTLENAARMRLPGSMTMEQRAKRVQSTLTMFGLAREKEQIVGKLSGGQRKRLSIAVEYIGNPSLFFLDEPDSGLDGIMAKELMMNLREIANQGKIVMVISHAPDRSIELFDRIIVLAKGEQDDCGHLIYYGTPYDGCRFFETRTLEGIVGRVNRKDEGGSGMADYYRKKYKEQLHS